MTDELPCVELECGTPPRGMLEDLISAQLLKSRLIILNEEIDEENAKNVVRQLIYLACLSNEPIKIILNSVGGEVYKGLLIYNTIKDLVQKGIEVTIEVRGLGASMACVIVQAATKRLASRRTRFLIHEVSSIAWGRTSEVQEQADELRKVNDLCKDILAERSKKTAEEIEKIWHKKDVWMSAEETLEFGLIDEIVD